MTTTAGIKLDASETFGALQFNGVDVVKFDANGITEGAGRRLAQVVSYSTNAYASGSTVIPVDDTIPQITEGDQYLSLSITPTNAASTLEITVEATFGSPSSVWISSALFVVGTADAIRSRLGYLNSAATVLPLDMTHSVSAGSTTARTYTVRAGAHTAATVGINGSSSRIQGGALTSKITIKEYLP